MLRAGLVTQLRERGELSDPRVAAVLGQVPRHVFVPGAELALAYADQSIDVGRLVCVATYGVAERGNLRVVTGNCPLSVAAGECDPGPQAGPAGL
jgi:protein-L-isoaspartate O-methyltransferase